MKEEEEEEEEEEEGRRAGEGDLQSNGLFLPSSFSPPLHHLCFWTDGKRRGAKDDLHHCGYFSPIDDDKNYDEEEEE